MISAIYAHLELRWWIQAEDQTVQEGRITELAAKPQETQKIQIPYVPFEAEEKCRLLSKHFYL